MEESNKSVRKSDRTSGRRSIKRKYEESDNDDDNNDEDEEEEDERPLKRSRNRSSNRNSRRNSLEMEENNARASRRSSRKFAEETAVERRASKRSLDTFNTISLSTLIDEIIKNKNSWPFTKPVSISEVPDYLDVIKRPMDFSKIKSKLNLGDYSTNDQAMKDIELVFYNCDLYNVAASEIYQ
jgi:bromodomain adjacent to zinc finger domain protein 1A